MKLIKLKYFGLLILVMMLSCRIGIIPHPPLPEEIPMDMTPVVDPSGRYIVYLHVTEDTTDTTGVYILDLETGEKTWLSREVSNPDFSPDGRWLVFNGGGQIFKVRLKEDMRGVDSSTLRQLTFEGENFYPRWSPDGNLIAFNSNREGPCCSIWLTDTSGQNQWLFWKFGRNPDWSPDGSELLFIGLVDSVSHGIIVDTSLSDTLLIDIGDDPAWSPDGEWIGYTDYGPGLRMKIYVTRVDGSNQRELIELNLRFDDSWTPAEPGGQVSWLDSHTLIFSAPNSEATRVVLWRINIDGTGLKQVTF